MSEKSKRGFVVGGIAVLVLAGLVVGFRRGKKAPPAYERPPARRDRWPRRPRSDVPVYMDEIGKTVAREVVTVSPQITGRLAEIHFTDGADERKGDLLFTIDPRPFEATAQRRPRDARPAEGGARARPDAVQEVRGPRRHARPSPRRSTTSRRNAVAVDEAHVKQAEAAVETERLNLQYCTIRSPIDGRAGRRLVDIGNVVEANKTQLMTIQKDRPDLRGFHRQPE